MKEIVFVSGKFSYKSHTLTASLNRDDYLTVRAEHKSRVLDLLGKAFDGISDTCGEAEDERLFARWSARRGAGIGSL